MMQVAANSRTVGARVTRRLFGWLYTRHLGQRIGAVDALRGLAIGGMILVNHPPIGGSVYAPLAHAVWDGWTLADTIFPAFLFVVGVSIALSLADARARGAAAQLSVHAKVLRRGLLLMLLSVALVNFPYYDPAALKLTGTLWRIGLCSMLASLAFLHLGQRGQAALLVLVLVVNWAVLRTFGASALLAFDQAVLGAHFRADQANGFDSTGLATTLGAFASTLCGVLAGGWLRTRPDTLRRAKGLLAAGLAASFAGLLLDAQQPVNKTLWSSAFVVLMAGLSMLALGALFTLQARAGGRRLLHPLEVAGVNALAFYVSARLLQLVLVYGRVRDPAGDPTVRLGVALYQTLLSDWIVGRPASLVYALAFLGVCYVGVYLLYRLRVFIKL